MDGRHYLATCHLSDSSASSPGGMSRWPGENSGQEAGFSTSEGQAQRCVPKSTPWSPRCLRETCVLLLSAQAPHLALGTWWVCGQYLWHSTRSRNKAFLVSVPNACHLEGTFIFYFLGFGLRPLSEHCLNSLNSFSTQCYTVVLPLVLKKSPLHANLCTCDGRVCSSPGKACFSG